MIDGAPDPEKLFLFVESTVVDGFEGGLQKREDDPGNWTGGQIGKGLLKGTKFGISAAAHPDLEIEALSRDDARSIYRRDYYDANRCGDMPPRFALATFDGAVLQGPTVAFCLQRALKVPEDGKIGEVYTLPAIRAADQDPNLQGLVRFFAERALSEDKILLARPGMISWIGNWEYRMAELQRIAYTTRWEEVC